MSVFSREHFTYTSSKKVIDCKEAQAISGTIYGVSLIDDTVADFGTLEMLFKTPADVDVVITDLITKLQDGAKTTGAVTVIEDAQYSGTLTELTPRNFNRQIGDVATVKVYSGAAYSVGTGTTFFVDRVFGQRGAEAENRFPAKLKRDTNYIVIFRNISNGTAKMVLRVVFGECSA